MLNSFLIFTTYLAGPRPPVPHTQRMEGVGAEEGGGATLGCSV